MNFSVMLKCIIYFSSNFKETELIQYLKPVGLGPSGKTCPKCEPQELHFTSILVIP